MSVNIKTPVMFAGFDRGFPIRMGFISAIILGAVVLSWPYIAPLAAKGHLHAPNLDVIWGLSPVIKVHLFAALAALALGAILMLVRKGRLFHRTAGWMWVALVATVAASSLFITQLTPGHWSFIHLLTGWVLFILPLAVFWAKRHNVKKHRQAMMGLFYGAFAINIAFTFIPGRAMWMVFFG